jgi:hypothetical protein
MDPHAHSVIWIWRGFPGSFDVDGRSSEPIGSGVLIAPGLVLTARHVVRPRDANGHEHPFEPTDISVAGDSIGVNGIGVADLIIHNTRDLAILRLDRTDPSAAWVELSLDPPAMPLDTEVDVYAYWDPGKGFSRKRARVASYSGKYRLFLIDTEAHSGNSGGPVFASGHLVGLVSTRDDGECWFLPLDRETVGFVYRETVLREVYSQLPISGVHLSELKDLLADVGEDPVPSQIAVPLFARLMGDAIRPQPTGNQTYFDACLQGLRRYHHKGDDRLLVFVAACRKRAKLDQRLRTEKRTALEEWLSGALKRANLSKSALDARVEAVLDPATDSSEGLILVRVARNLLAVEPVYLLDAWTAERELLAVDTPEVRPGICYRPLDLPREPVPFAQLGEHLGEAVSAGRARLRETLGREVWPRIEVVVPTDLLHWDLGGAEVNGAAVTSAYEVYLRCCERHYPELTDPLPVGALRAWKERCESLDTLGVERLESWQLCCVDQVTDPEALAKLLADDRQLWSLVGERPGGSNTRGGRHLIAGLRAGLPYMIWPLSKGLDTKEIRTNLKDWLVHRPHREWPTRLRKARSDDHPDWVHLALLWDHRDRLVPPFSPAHPPQ